MIPATINITAAEQASDYALRLSFDDGTVQTVDFKPFLSLSRHPAIRAYLEPERFAGFRIEYGELVWGDYMTCASLSWICTATDWRGIPRLHKQLECAMKSLPIYGKNQSLMKLLAIRLSPQAGKSLVIPRKREFSQKRIPLRSKGKPQRHIESTRWIPAFAGMTL